MPILPLPRLMAAARVVPVPQNGSSTTPPERQVDIMGNLASEFDDETVTNNVAVPAAVDAVTFSADLAGPQANASPIGVQWPRRTTPGASDAGFDHGVFGACLRQQRRRYPVEEPNATSLPSSAYDAPASRPRHHGGPPSPVRADFRRRALRPPCPSPALSLSCATPTRREPAIPQGLHSTTAPLSEISTPGAGNRHARSARRSGLPARPSTGSSPANGAVAATRPASSISARSRICPRSTPSSGRSETSCGACR